MPAYAGNSRRGLLESYRKPRAVDRHDRPSFLITERKGRHPLNKVELSTKCNLKNKVGLNERCWAQIGFFRQSGCNDIEGKFLPGVSLQNGLAHAIKRFA